MQCLKQHLPEAAADGDETYQGVSMENIGIETKSQVEASAGYSLAKFIALRWINSSQGKIRLARGEALDVVGPVLLVLNGSPSFVQMAAVAATLDRPIHFLLPLEACQGFWARWLAEKMGVIWQGLGQSDPNAALRAAREALGRGEVIGIFAQVEPRRSESLSPSCRAAAQLAAGAGVGGAGGHGVKIIPVHVLSSYGAVPAGELLLTPGSHICARDFQGGASAEASVRTLAGALEDGLAQNPYRLDARDVRFFLDDLEKVLRADLEEDWAARPNWKQKTEGFEISRFIVECAEGMNVRDPAALAGLRIELESYREELRRWSLVQAEVEQAKEWLQSPASRMRYWLEAVMEAPIAFYGFINHLIPILLLMPGNLFRRLAKKDPGQAWLLRVLVVLGTYILLVSICARGWGRAAAGYYTLTLPLSGLVLWRFSNLVRTRVRLLYLSRSLSRREERLRQLRKRFIEHLNQARDEFAAAIGSLR